MKQKGSMLLLPIFLAIVFGVGVYFIYLNRQNVVTTQPFPSPIVTKEDEIKFTGILTEIDVGCDASGTCIADSPIRAKIDKYWVIIDLMGDPNPEMGRQRGPRGKIYLSDGTIMERLPSDSSLGANVEVFAKVIDETTLSLYGNSQYYIKF